jgi:hypothetical protein
MQPERRKVDQLNNRVRRIVPIFQVFSLSLIFALPIYLLFLYRDFPKPSVTIADPLSFFEEVYEGEEPLKHTKGDILRTNSGEKKFLTFKPFADLHVLVHSCTSLAVDEINYQKAQKLALISLTVKSVPFCPTHPQIVVNRELK